jgi:NitT/TauT family transport system substrate-binding protein
MRRTCVRLAALALLALAPAVSHAQATKPLKTVTLAIGGRTLFSYLPVTLADTLGYFKDEGLEVQFNDFAGGSKSIEALVGGSADFAVGAYENTLFLQAKGADVQAVTLLTDRFGLVFALNKKYAARYKSPKDIKGLKIGVTAPGSAVSNALEIILAKDKLKGSDVSMIGIGGGPGAVAAVKAGRVDGLVLSDPAISRLEADGDIVPIVDSRTAQGQDYLYGGPNANSSVLVTAKFAKEHPQTVQHFVNAVVRTLRWMKTAKLDAVMAKVPPAFYKGDKAIYEKSLALNMDGFTKDGRLTHKLAMVTYNTVKDSGRIKDPDKLDVARTYDDAFWKKAPH